MIAIHCSCGAIVPIASLRDVRVLVMGDEDLVGGTCPLCGSTRYAPACEVTREDVELCADVELLGDGRLANADVLATALEAAAA